MMNTNRFLMCPPDHYGVEYVINPWMQGKQGSVGLGTALLQWDGLYTLLTGTLGADVALVAPEGGLPDMVFTANAGLARGGVCVPARFRHPERQGEEPHFADWFTKDGWELKPLPAGVAFEGAGDALWDQGVPGLLWAAHGFRTDLAAHPHLARAFGAEVVSLRLTDPRFYHLDTCFCPLPGGHLLWHPPAFDAASRALVEARVPAARRAAVCEEDALLFACNAVSIGRAVVLNDCTDALAAWLRARGFEPHPTPLTEFIKAGGAAKCLTLRLG